MFDCEGFITHKVILYISAADMATSVASQPLLRPASEGTAANFWHKSCHQPYLSCYSDTEAVSIWGTPFLGSTQAEGLLLHSKPL